MRPSRRDIAARLSRARDYGCAGPNSSRRWRFSTIRRLTACHPVGENKCDRVAINGSGAKWSGGCYRPRTTCDESRNDPHALHPIRRHAGAPPATSRQARHEAAAKDQIGIIGRHGQAVAPATISNSYVNGIGEDDEIPLTATPWRFPPARSKRKRNTALSPDRQAVRGGDDERRIALYSAYLDTAAIEAAGLNAQKPSFARSTGSGRQVIWFLCARRQRPAADPPPLNATNFYTQHLGLFVRRRC